MLTKTVVAGGAALTICESLMLCLTESGVISEAECVGILEDAAAAHEIEDPDESQRELHAAIAAFIRKIIEGGNSVRKS